MVVCSPDLFGRICKIRPLCQVHTYHSVPDTSRVLRLRHRLEQSARDTWFEELVKLVSAKAGLFKPFGGIRPPNQIAGLTKGPTQLT